MAKEQSRKGKAIPATTDAPGDRRGDAEIRAPSGPVTITAGKRSATAGKDTPAPGAAVAQTNAGGVGLGVVSAEAFIELVNRGIKSWIVAGELLVAWLSMEPTAYQLIRNEAPWISLATLEMFERLGRHSLYPKVLLLPPMLAERVGRLSYAVQERMCALPENEVRALVATKIATHVTHKDRGRDCQRPGPAPKERSHVANLPCAGYFKLTLNGTDASLHRCAKDDRALPVVLGVDGSVVLQVMSPNGVQSDSDQTPDSPDELHDGLTPAER